MRDLLFVLEARQSSPRATLILSTEDIAEEVGKPPDAVEVGLNVLLDLDYIDGPGADEPGFWFFRKLTRKGNAFVAATQRPADWERLKRSHALRADPSDPG